MALKSFWIAPILLAATLLGFNYGRLTEERHWAYTSVSPMVITVYDITNDPGWNQALRDLALEWDTGLDNVTLRFGTGEADCEKGNGPHTVVVCIHSVDPKNGAETHWRLDRKGHFQRVRIWIDPEATSKWRLACHELGHALGLPHRPEGDESCMTRSAGWRHPDRQDFQMLNDAYGHVHS